MQRIISTITSTSLLVLAATACDGVDDGSIPESVLLADDEQFAGDPALGDEFTPQLDVGLAELADAPPEADGPQPADAVDQLATEEPPPLALVKPLKAGVGAVFTGDGDRAMGDTILGQLPDPAFKSGANTGKLTISGWFRIDKNPANPGAKNWPLLLFLSNANGQDPLDRYISVQLLPINSVNRPHLCVEYIRLGTQLKRVCVLDDSLAPGTGKFHHFAHVLDPADAAGGFRIYIDGVERKYSLPKLGSMSHTRWMLALGRSSAGYNPLMAMLEEFRIWDQPLTATNITSIMNNFSAGLAYPGPTASQIAYLPFNGPKAVDATKCMIDNEAVSGLSVSSGDLRYDPNGASAQCGLSGTTWWKSYAAQ